jgi:hypothetical protein
LAFDGIEFYGTAEVPKANSDFILKDIVFKNIEYQNRPYKIYHSKKYVILGDGNECWYTYNTKKQRYVRIYEDHQVINEYKTFDAMLDDAFQITYFYF